MGYDANGNYTRTHNWSADASANIKIIASRMDAEFDDFASALALPLLRDGRNAATGNIPMGGFRLVNVGAPASATNYMRAKDVIENVPIYVVDAESSADRISVSAAFYTTASAATAPRDGSNLIVKMGSDKSSAVAIRINTGDGNPHSAGVVLSNGSAIYSGALRSGGIYDFIWSSSDTAWQLRNPQVDYAASAYPGVILLATAAEVAAGTDVPKAVTPAQLADKFSADYATTASAGLIELATTAEVATGTNVSVAITPSTLHAYASVATTVSAGLLEIATTAEVAAVADTSRAVTPATLAQHSPYLMYLECVSSAANLDPVIRSNNSRASTWTFTSAGAQSFRVVHNLGLASAGELIVNLQTVMNSVELSDLFPVINSAGASAFSFHFFNTSGSVEFVSTGVFMQAFRIS